jgi:dienelactone hydrolase
MGSTLQWREPPDRDARDFETFVEFGRGRRSGTGFMAYSERSGPGVVLLHPPPSWTDPVLDLARRIHSDGFTVLVPDDRSSSELERMGAAADYLLDNWHPRLGFVGFGSSAEIAVQLADTRGCDALVLYGGEEAGMSVRTPVLRQPAGSASTTAHEETLEFLRYHLS